MADSGSDDDVGHSESLAIGMSAMYSVRGVHRASEADLSFARVGKDALGRCGRLGHVCKQWRQLHGQSAAHECQ